VVVGAGAKILGPFTVHKGAKVGSNAVITKEVPEGVTAVGNPARYIFKIKPRLSRMKHAVVIMLKASVSNLMQPLKINQIQF
jgi:serine acetyltransferase